MLEIIIFGFVFWLGFEAGMYVFAWKVRDLLIREAKREGIIDENLNIIDNDEPSVHKLVLEKTNNMLYLYDHEASSFVCQATSIEELAKLAKQYKNIKYAAVMDVEGDSIYTFVDGKVEIKI